eukprot:g59632.t1
MGATNSRDPATMEDRPSPIEVVIPKVDAPTGTDLLPHHSSSPAQGNEQSGRKADEDASEDEGEKSPRPITYSPNYAFMPDLIPPSPVIETRDRDRDEEKEKHRSGKDVMKRGRKPKERVVLSGKHVKIPARSPLIPHVRAGMLRVSHRPHEKIRVDWT